jgi:hypothetical protein
VIKFLRGKFLGILQPFRVRTINRIATAIPVPVTPVLDRIAGEEAADRRVVIPMSKELEAGGVLLVAEGAPFPVPAFPGATKRALGQSS